MSEHQILDYIGGRQEAMTVLLRELVTRESGTYDKADVDVLGELIDRWPGGAPDVPSVQGFAELRDDIERIKTGSIVRAISELAEMKQRNPDEYARLAPKLREILEVDSDKSR